MANLLVHCGARHVDRDQLENTPTPPASNSWVPIPHARLLEQVVSTLDVGGLRVANQAHALSADGARYFGLLELVNGQVSDTYNLVVGVRNSHDKSFSASIAVGSCVFVCDNLAFSAEVVLARKHTRFIHRDLPNVVGRAVGRLGELRVEQDRRIEAYRDAKLSDEAAHHLLIQTLDLRVLPPTRLPAALQEWRHPAHADFSENGKTAWRFFNAITEAIKGRALDELPRRTRVLHGLVDTAIGLQPVN